jgi:signal transduction histidine kinase
VKDTTTGRWTPLAYAAEDLLFIGSMALPFVLLALSRPSALVDASALVGLVCAVCALGAWIAAGTARAAGRLDLAPAAMYLVMVAFLRDASSGYGSGFGALAFVPLMYLALRGRKAEVIACILGIAAVFLFPAFAIGGPKYPLVAELRRAAVWTLVSAIVGPAVAHVVTRLRVAERTAAETAAHSDREHLFLDAVLNTIQDGVVALDRTGRAIVINNSMRESLRLTPGAAENGLDALRSVTARMDPETGARDSSVPGASPGQRALRGEPVTRELFVTPQTDGTERVSEVSALPITNAEGELLGAVTTIHDVTAQRHAERMKEHFLALVSHELRTPLSSVLGYLALLRDEEMERLSDDGRAFLQVMERNGDRLMRLITDLLFVAQMGRVELSVDPAEFDLRSAVLEAQRAALPKAAVRGQHLTVDLGEERGTVLGDRQRIGQVLDNLISNALKFAPAGGNVQVRIGRTQCGGAVRIDVSDDGPGIDPTDHERIFGRFARTARAEADAIEGVGLGLWICRAIMHAHGGAVKVESTPGSGATFSIILPHVSSDADTVRDLEQLVAAG